MMACCLCLSAQPDLKKGYRAGLKFSLTGATATGGRTKTYLRASFGGGLWVQLRMTKKWAARMEVLYAEKGGSGQWYSFSRPGTYWFNLNYLEVPLLFHYYKKKAYFEFGPGIAYLLSGNEKYVGATVPDLSDSYPFESYEVSFNAGLGYSVNEKWQWGFRVTHSLLPVRNELPGISKRTYNRFFALSVYRQLNFKKQKKDTQLPDSY